MSEEQQPGGAAAYSSARERTEAKNQAVRDSLEPLAPGERPLAVTIAAVIAFLLAIGNILAYALSDDTGVSDKTQAVMQTFLISVVLLVAAWGMWKAKYWAVLGFQTLLGLQVIFLVLALTRASHLWVVLLFLGIIALYSVLFWFLIRAMARLQMPEAPDVQKLKKQREEAERHDG